MTDFTVRERILLYLLDAGKDEGLFRADICKAIGSKSGNACWVFKEMVNDKVIVVRRAKGIKNGNTTQVCITEKGRAVAMTQVWRMREAGIKGVPLLPHTKYGAKPKVVA